MREELQRTALLLDDASLQKIQNSKVAVFGIGGVGSYVVEALARVGIGSFILVDHDLVSVSNINRQLIALHSTVGRPKVEVAKDRILDISPNASVYTYKEFYLPGQDIDFLSGCDYIVDAIDTVSSKLALVEAAEKMEIPILSSMGTGNKLDPSRFQIDDIYNTSVCPLCRVMRRELRKRGISKLKVLYSLEEPIRPKLSPELMANGKRKVPGSISFVPSCAGLLIAGEVIRDLIQKPDLKNNQCTVRES